MQSISTPTTRPPLICFPSLQSCLFCKSHIMESFNKYSYISDFFYIMFLWFIHFVICMSNLFLFIAGYCIPLYKYATFCLSIHQLMNISIVPSFWWLWIMLWPFTFKSCCGRVEYKNFILKNSASPCYTVLLTSKLFFTLMKMANRMRHILVLNNTKFLLILKCLFKK